MTRFQKQWLVGWAVALTLWGTLSGCGISPEQAADELDWSAAHPEEWCGWVHDNGLELGVAKTIPDDYGNSGAPGGCNSTGAWPGGFCWVPANTNITWQVTLNSGLLAWNLSEQAAVNALESVVDPLAYWEITQVGSNGNFESYFGTTHPQGYLGSAFMSSYLAVSTSQGEMRLYEYCAAVVYKAHVEANWAYQAASSSQRSKYIYNLAKHEGGHCLGTRHQDANNNTLMSIGYTFPGPYFDSYLGLTSAEIQRIADWAY